MELSADLEGVSAAALCRTFCHLWHGWEGVTVGTKDPCIPCSSAWGCGLCGAQSGASWEGLAVLSTLASKD